MTTIERATPEQVRHVALNMRPRDYAEFSAFAQGDTREELAEALATRYGGRDDVLCGAVGDEPICIGGAIETWPGVMTLLFFATPAFPRIGMAITRFIRNDLFPRYEAAGVHRIQAVSLDGYEQVHHWLNAIGLKPETPPMPGYGKNGEAFIQFARVRDVCPIGP